MVRYLFQPNLYLRSLSLTRQPAGIIMYIPHLDELIDEHSLSMEIVELDSRIPPPQMTVHDTSYPIGRITSNPQDGSRLVQTCAGALVDPRHVLTASRCAVWGKLADNTHPIRRVKFQPDYYDGDVFPSANLIQTYWYLKVHKNAGPPNYFSQGEDFLVGILDRRVRDSNGYFGTVE